MKTRVLSVYVALIVSTPVAVFAQQRQAIDNARLSDFVQCAPARFHCDDRSAPLNNEEVVIHHNQSKAQARRMIYKVGLKTQPQQFVLISELIGICEPEAGTQGPSKFCVSIPVLVEPSNDGRSWQYVKP